MKTLTQIKEDNTVISGLILLGLSLFVFLITMSVEVSNFEPFQGAFFLNYGLFFIYFLVITGKNKAHTGKFFRFYNMNANAILLAMANISAYSLNRSIPVFNESVEWLVVFLVMLNVAMIGVGFRQSKRPDALNYTFVGILTAGALLSFYQIFYTLPAYPIGVIAFWFLGIPLHIFVPLWYFIFLILMVKKHLRVSLEYRKAVVAGLAIPLVFFGYVVWNWVQINKAVDLTYHTQQAAYETDDLPEWVNLSKHIPKNWLTKRALKSNIVYTAFDPQAGDFFSIDRIGFNERTKHDPFVAAASLFAGPIDLDRGQKLSLLKAIYNQRHESERRLWSGDNLSTSDIVTNVQLFPEHRLAYTEKTLTIKNNKKRRTWSPSQEAIYSFYLPEGSVITSASLWVEGEERPSFLTTKAKSDSAYTTIVGRERRDPLLLHWREGNQVSIRVFPCTPKEDRQFKIGITTPLHFKDDELIYNNIDFVGPHWGKAVESINVVHEGLLEDFDSSIGLSSNGTDYTYYGSYKSDWTLQMKAVPVSTDAFEFNGKRFVIETQKEQLENFNATEIYLDINSAWSKSEVNRVWDLVKGKDVFVFTNRLVKFTAGNKKVLSKYLRKQHFSLFPLYHIQNPDNALVISKSSIITPTLSDLKGSSFAQKTNDFMQRLQSPMKLYSLNSEPSAYIKMMKELRLFEMAEGDETTLSNLISNKQFPSSLEDARTISLDESNVVITQKDHLENHSSAPDHLMRLFAYNDLMKQLGKDYFNKENREKDLVHIAEEAHVVSPISSLIVLETQADYDRFDIKKNKNSLDNAKMKSSGAVPEPHEWVLIILSLFIVLWVRFKR